MPNSTFVSIPKSISVTISRWAELAYPNEGCGILIGRFTPNGEKEVVNLIPLTNELVGQNVTNAPTLPTTRQGTGAGKTEFVMSPSEFNRESLAAAKMGLDVVGIIHTHPDHPPRPSAIDAAQPFLAQWSNIIVAIDKNKKVEMKSWFRDSDDQPFVEEEIRIREK